MALCGICRAQQPSLVTTGGLLEMFLEGLFHLQLTWLILILENRHRLGDHVGDTGVMQGAQFEPPCLFQLPCTGEIAEVLQQRNTGPEKKRLRFPS